VVPLLMLAVKVTNCRRSHMGANSSMRFLDTLTLPMETKSPDDVLAAGAASFSMPAAHTPWCTTQNGHAVAALCAASSLPAGPPTGIGVPPKAVATAEHKDVDRTRRPRCGCR